MEWKPNQSTTNIENWFTSVPGKYNSTQMSYKLIENWNKIIENSEKYVLEKSINFIGMYQKHCFESIQHKTNRESFFQA